MDNSEELVICDNPIVDFLKQKVQIFRNEISKTKETIDFLSKKTDEVLNEVAVSSMGVKLSPPLLKLNCDKYILWYRVKNTTNRSFQNFEFLFHWDSDDELTYSCSMHPGDVIQNDINKPLTFIEGLVDKAFLVVILDRPLFLCSQTVQIEGFLSYNDQNGGNYVDDIEPIILKSSDVSNKSLLLSAEYPDILNFYSRLVSSFRYEFVLHFENITGISEALVSASLIPCKLGMNKSKRFFEVNDDGYCFKGLILEITARNDLNHMHNVCVYTRDENGLLAFSHHLHHTTKPVVFLPIEYKFAISTKNDLIEKKHIFEACMKKEISSLLDMSRNSHEFYEDYSNKRKHLIDLEHDTDSAYVEYLRTEEEYLQSLKGGPRKT